MKRLYTNDISFLHFHTHVEKDRNEKEIDRCMCVMVGIDKRKCIRESIVYKAVIV